MKALVRNPMDLTGKTVLVTGASSGIGQGIAQCLSELGARVVVTARSADRLNLAALHGSGHFALPIDLAMTDELPSWLKRVVEEAGPLDGLVHSAGLMLSRPVRMFTSADWARSLELNVVAASALAKGFRQKSVCRDAGGSIVYLSSVMGLVGQPGQSLYSATKGALVSMTRSLALEFARDRIRVNCVAPAVIDAGMSRQIKASLDEVQWERIVAQHPLGIGRVEDVSNAVAFLLADSARWITGTTLVVDGGYTAQ